MRADAPWRPALLAVLALGSSACGADEAEPVAVALEGRPSAVAADPAADVLWVVDDARNVARRYDLDGEPVGDDVPVDPQPVAVAAGGGGVWIAHASGLVTRLDGEGAPLGPPTDLGGALVDVVVDGDRAWVGDIASGTVVDVDASTGEPGEAIEVPAGVVRLALDGDRLWVTNLEHTVTPVDLRDRVAGEPVEVGLGPIGVTAAGDDVWVANSDDDTVTRLGGETVRVGDAPIQVAVVGDDVWSLDQDGRTASRVGDQEGGVDLATRPRGFAAAGGSLWVIGVEPSMLVEVEVDSS